MFRDRNFFFSQQITNGVTVAVRLQIFHISLIDHLSAQAAGFRPDIYDVIRCTDDFFVMFHDDNRITQLLQLTQYVYQLVGIATV